MQARPARFLPGAAGTQDLASWLRGFAARPENRGALVHWHTIPARPARFGELLPPLAGPVQGALGALGVTALYSHQVRAIEALRAGRDTVVVTGTASGKSLCFHLPALERLHEEPGATALYLFPTKALAQDQLKSLTRLATGDLGLTRDVQAGVYDGDTATGTRRKLREQGNVILSNPDMLHAGILPQHARWARFLRNLRYVVVDEMHAYRGIFGSHVANVLRRLERLVRHYGGEYRYVLCSATIRNPGELAHALTGRDVEVVDDDGAPRGEKHFVLWNPPYRDATRVERRSSNVEGCQLLAGLIQNGAQAIAFTKSRVSAELVYRYTREQLERACAPHLGAAAREAVPQLKPYRGGYLPEERREIERALFSGELRGVVSTNALELGIDVGGLDAAVLIGAAPTLASIWQQAGRAGRSGSPSVVVLVGYNDTVDQYLMRRPEFLFARSPEAACIDPHNPYILAQQLACAAYELPVAPEDEAAFGPQTRDVLAALEDAGETRVIDERAYWAKSDFPGAKVSLRSMSDDTYTIQDASRGQAVMGTVDAISGLELVYPGAIYLHDGESFFVKDLDLVQKIATVEPREVDYYTQPVLDTNIRVRGELRTREWGGERVVFGEVTYSWQTIAMKKIKYRSLDAIGYHPLELPRLTLESAGFWIGPREETWRGLVVQGHNPWEALSGVRNLFVQLLPLMAMCDPYDLGGMIDSSNLGRPAIFLFDRYPGGLGFAEQGWARLGELAEAARAHLEGCPCGDGCPACVGLPIFRPAQQQDLDAMKSARAIPGKDAARALLATWRAASSDRA
ncbi:MAG TPA: DEAD/DEAH box helicase [Candidatus Acidoferrales bacterium]|nr:DEAD/DEAH box helicase [Candidatus Acidoferrales bacterium]